MTVMLEINDLDIVFGQNTAQAIQLIDQGETRQQIQEKTGSVVGVRGVNLQVNKGEICVLMGLSGSGKSSLLRAVNGLNPISRGQLRLRDGTQMVDLAQCDARTLQYLRTHRVSMVFQKFALMPWLTVWENAAFGLMLQGVDKQQQRILALEKLDLVGLSDWADVKPHALSGGMQQRVGLARALMMDSDILLMDEPFSALDPLIRTQLQDELLDIQTKLQKTIVFVSHDLDEALKLGNHIAIMESGQIIQHGEPEQIVLKPENKYVADFVAHTNPLNVLRGETLMLPLADMAYQKEMYRFGPDHQYWAHIMKGRLARAGCGDQEIPILTDQSQPGCFRLAETDIDMRTAIAMRQETGLPVLLHNGGTFAGILSDDQIYQVLLGR